MGGNVLRKWIPMAMAVATCPSFKRYWKTSNSNAVHDRVDRVATQRCLHNLTRMVTV